jgi:hypothetical protein
LLGSNERPNLIALEPSAGKVAKVLILIFGAREAEINKQFGDSILCHSGHANGSANAIAFNETPDDLYPFRVV